jgi:four helix bundle protein
VRDHTSLVAWQRARSVTRGVLAAARLNRNYWAQPTLAQLQRAALSVQLNIAEGYARRQRPSFAYHLNVAYGSAVETGELLELCRDELILPPDITTALLHDCRESQRTLLGLLRQIRCE